MDQDLVERAQTLLDQCRTKGLTIAAAESCTGGLLAATLTEIAGSSDVFERGFVTYSIAGIHSDSATHVAAGFTLKPQMRIAG